jgi:S-adenosylmethionine-diacylglycerol 3-amino-3-carboxypropyl transferase
VAHQPSLLDRIHHRAFGMLHGSSLLYNACWEDPALDRVALDLGSDDTVMVITSAGCNALDYALCGPRRVVAVDANPRQNALLELKLAGIRRLSFDEFFAVFGSGGTPDFPELYADRLREGLSPFAQRFWDRRQHWFLARGWRRTFYFHGLSGLAARLVHSWVGRDRPLRDGLAALLDAPDLGRQRETYDRDVAPRLWTAGLEWMLARRSTLSLLGVPHAQRSELEASHPGGAAGFIRAAVDTVFRDLPLRDNYFWQVYLTGSYTRACCPEYLKRGNFYALKQGLVDRIEVRTDTVTGLLARDERQVSRFVLLDHMDWMSWYRPDDLADEWRQILRRAAPGARVLFRSSSPEPHWLGQVRVEAPGGAVPITDRLRFDRPLARELHARDRVHTYASFHIAHITA